MLLIKQKSWIPVNSGKAENDDYQGDEEAKQGQVYDVSLVRQFWRIPVWVAANSRGNGNEPVPAKRWRHCQNDRIYPRPFKNQTFKKDCDTIL